MKYKYHMDPSNAPEKKTNGEWTAVYAVFPKEKYKVCGTLRPDFLVSPIGEDYTMGIEVTSFFFHMGSARLKRDETYLQDVLDGHPHEKDIAIMRKDTLILLEQNDENGNEIELEVVAYTHPPFAEFIALLGQEIEKKNTKYSNYQGPASRLHLIIVDEENYFSGSTVEQVSAQLVRDDVFNAQLQSAVFYEIFLLTNVSTNKCYIPLKQALFFSKQRLTSLFFYRKLMPEVSISQYVIVFLNILARLGYTQMKAFREGDGKVCFVYQNMIIKIDNAGVSEIFLTDSPIFDFMDPLSTLLENATNQLPAEVFNDYIDFQKENYALLHEVIHFLPALDDGNIQAENANI